MADAAAKSDGWALLSNFEGEEKLLHLHACVDLLQSRNKTAKKVSPGGSQNSKTPFYLFRVLATLFIVVVVQREGEEEGAILLTAPVMKTAKSLSLIIVT